MDAFPVLTPSPKKKSPVRLDERPLHAITSAPASHHNLSSSDSDNPYSSQSAHSEDEAIFDRNAIPPAERGYSPHTSSSSAEEQRAGDEGGEVSEFPSSAAGSTIYTPHRRRSPFRNPSSGFSISLSKKRTGGWSGYGPGGSGRSYRYDRALASPTREGERSSTPRSRCSDSTAISEAGKMRSARESPVRPRKGGHKASKSRSKSKSDSPSRTQRNGTQIRVVRQEGRETTDTDATTGTGVNVGPGALANDSRTRKEHPLVLLHVTLLPLITPYPQSVLEAVLPPRVLQNWKVVREKAGSRMVRERGVLIPHPRDDYDLLEERLLEALELEPGRLTRDGHFLAPRSWSGAEEYGSLSRAASTRCSHEDCAQDTGLAGDCIEAGDYEHDTDDYPVDGVYDDEADDTRALCPDCGQRIRRIDDGSSANRRWDVRIYAANGLMREGAWTAAWRDMERVDAEIVPHMSEQMAAELDAKWEEMEMVMAAAGGDGAAEVSMLVGEQAVEPAALEAAADALEQRAGDGSGGAGGGGADGHARRMREIYGEAAQAVIDGLVDEPQKQRGGEGAARRALEEARLPRPGPRRRRTTDRTTQRIDTKDVPLPTLLANYCRLLLQDQRTVALAFLSLIVVLIAVIAVQARSMDAPSPLTYAGHPLTSSFASATQPVGNAFADPASAASGAAEAASEIWGVVPAPSSPTVEAVEGLAARSMRSTPLVDRIVDATVASSGSDSSGAAVEEPVLDFEPVMGSTTAVELPGEETGQQLARDEEEEGANGSGADGSRMVRETVGGVAEDL